NIADISSLGATEIGYLDVAISSRSSHNAAAIWAVATRNLTSQAFPFTNPGAALDVSNIRTAAYGQYNTEMARITANVATEAKQNTIDGIVDDIKAKTVNLPAANVDVSGFITWVTLTHTTTEGDISALFSTDLTGTTRRSYAVYIDLTGCEADGAAWTTCTVRVKIDFGVGDAYRTVDKKAIAKTDVAAAAEPGVPIDVPATAKNVQITLQFDVQLAADATIYYSYVKEALE
ncbi:unnamed protein product, partial [marine sediment metagenome]